LLAFFMSLTRSSFAFKYIESALDYLDRTVPDEQGNIYGVDKQVAKFMFSNEDTEYMLVGSEDVYMAQREKWM